VIDCVVSPFDHVFPVALDDVKVTEPPEQKVVAPIAVIVGGFGFIVIVVGIEVALHVPLDEVTE
jgi:hypothetical protein